MENVGSRGFTVLDFQKFLDQISQISDLISFLDSAPGLDVLPAGRLEEIALTVFTEYKDELYSYGSPRGFAPLRERIGEFFYADPRLKDNIVITTGSQQGLDLVLRVLKRRYRRSLSIALEDPTYIGFKHISETQGHQYYPVPLKADGLDLENLQRLIKSRKIDVLYLIPDYQNPTGTVLGKSKREQLVRLAAKNNLFLIEDLAYRWLKFDESGIAALPRITQLYANAAAVGSFSKILTPGVRVGWILLPPDLTDSFIMEKRATELAQPYFFQILLYEFIKRGYLTQHLRWARKIYRAKRDFLNLCLREYLPAGFSWKTPQGGFYFWIKCDLSSLNTYGLLQKAMVNQVAFGAGRMFSLLPNKDQFFRLSFSTPSLKQIETGVKRLSATLTEMKLNRKKPELFSANLSFKLKKWYLIYLYHFWRLWHKLSFSW